MKLPPSILPCPVTPLGLAPLALAALGLAPLGLATLGLATPLGAQISWEGTLELARKKAKADKQVLVLALHTSGVRDSDRIVAQHYRDPAITRLAAKTVNLFCSNDAHAEGAICPRCGFGSCADHRNNDFNVRRTIFKIDDARKVVVPQHVFVTPGGVVISAAAEYLTVGELEWMWVQAIRVVEPGFPWPETGRYRAPQQFIKGDVDPSGMDHLVPPTRDEVKAVIEGLEKSDVRRGIRGRGRGLGSTFDEVAWDLLTRSDSGLATKFAQDWLKGRSDERAQILHKIAERASPAWARLVWPYLDVKQSDPVRRAAIHAVRRLGDDRSIGKLRGLLLKEDDDLRKGLILRALATLGPTKAPVIATVRKAQEADSDLLRAHATVAAGILEDREAVTGCLRTALQDRSIVVRSTAAYVIAVRQDKTLAPALESARAAEAEDEVREWMVKAQATLRSQDPSAFLGFLYDTIDRPR